VRDANRKDDAMRSCAQSSKQVLRIAAALVIAASDAQAEELPFAAVLAIRIAGPVQGVPVPMLSGSGVAVANGSGGASHIDTLELAGSTFATAALFCRPPTPPHSRSTASSSPSKTAQAPSRRAAVHSAASCRSQGWPSSRSSVLRI
jgi:hypothetical protein